MKTPVSDRINDALGLASFEKSVEAMTDINAEIAVESKPVVSTEIAPPYSPTGDPDRDLESDLQHAKANLRTLSEKAQEAVDLNLDFARQSDNPKAYEALAQILQAAISASTALMGVNKVRADIKAKTKTDTTNVNNNNTAVVITTHDLLKMFRDSTNIIDAEIEEN